MNDTDLIYDEESSEKRMKAIGQNGNTGEHYSASIPTWTHTITKADQRTMSQVSSSTAIASNISFGGEAKQEQQLPDARKHQIISFIKSGVRLFGYVLLPFDIVAATVVLFTSEIIGILEELV